VIGPGACQWGNAVVFERRKKPWHLRKPEIQREKVRLPTSPLRITDVASEEEIVCHWHPGWQYYCSELEKEPEPVCDNTRKNTRMAARIVHEGKI